MNCEQVQQQLAVAALDPSQALPEQDLTVHLERCDICRSALQEWTAVGQALQELPERPVPLAARRAVLQHARQAVSPAADSGWAWLREWLLDWRNPMLPIFMGLLTTSVFALVLAMHMDLSLLPPLGLTLAGAMWTGLFAVVFYLFSMGMRRRPFLRCGKNYLPRRWFSSQAHTHVALDDAREQGELFMNMLRENMAGDD